MHGTLNAPSQLVFFSLRNGVIAPSGQPNAMIGRRPMNRLMPTGLPGPSSTNSTFGSLIRTGLPSASISNFTTPEEADHLLGRDAVDPLGRTRA